MNLKGLIAALLFLLPKFAFALPSHHDVDSLVITNSNGEPIPFVNVSVNGGVTRIGNANGVLLIRVHSDSLNLLVRRLGFVSFQGMVSRNDSHELFRVTLPIDSRKKKDSAQTVESAETLPLVRNGFYERMQQAQNGAMTGEFLTPEDIRSRTVSKASQYLNASRYVTVGIFTGTDGVDSGRARAFLQGRIGCPINLLVDGVAIRDALGDVNVGTDLWSRYRASLDDLVGATDVMAIEVYPSLATAPASLSLRFLNSSCGLVAIWTRLR